MLLRQTITLLAASLPMVYTLAPRTDICTEGSQRICYDHDTGLDRAHVQYVAYYLRWLGSSNEGNGRFWTIPAESGDSCAEWTLPVPDAGPVLALGKHIKPWLNSSVLYADLAAAIDGEDGLLKGCSGAGQVGVMADAENPLYKAEEYKKSGAKPDGILVKLVRAPAEEN